MTGGDTAMPTVLQIPMVVIITAAVFLAAADLFLMLSLLDVL